MARLAAIDIGSNAFRLRIVEVDPPVMTAQGPRFLPFRDVLLDRAAVRLGHDVFTKGRIETGVIGAACEALRRFRTAMDVAKVDRYRAVATSAAREASNGDVFVERAEREAGVHVEVIEGVEEARLVQIAVTERVSLGTRSALLVDVGGGSTELTLLAGERNVYSQSCPIGTVRLTENFLEGGKPVDLPHRKLIEEYVDRAIADAVRDIAEAGSRSIDLLVGTGGNIETLADLCPLPKAFPEGRAIDVAAMARLLDELCKRTVEERVAAYNLRPDRADTIIPAATVALVKRSMRMNEPVVRFSSYRSKAIGSESDRLTRPMSLRPSVLAASGLNDSMSTWCFRSLTAAPTVRVPDLSR